MVRQINFSNEFQNRAALTISAAMYERKALDCSSILPLIVSLNNLAYLVANNRRIRDMVCVDGGLERLLRILRDVPKNPTSMPGYNRHRPTDHVLPMWKWTTAFQCMVHLCIRGGIHVRERAVEAGIVPILVKVLESYLCLSDAMRNEKKRAIEERKRSEKAQRAAESRSRSGAAETTSDTNSGHARQAGNERERDRDRTRRLQQQPQVPDLRHQYQRDGDVQAQAQPAPAPPQARPSEQARLSQRDIAVEQLRNATPNAASVASPSAAQFHATRPSLLAPETTSATARAPTTTRSSRASSSRTSSTHSMEATAAAAASAATIPTGQLPTSSGQQASPWPVTAGLAVPQTVSSTLAASSSPSSSPSSPSPTGSSLPANRPAVSATTPGSSLAPNHTSSATLSSRSLGNVSSAEDLRDAASNSGSEAAEDAEMSADAADGDESEADVPMETTHNDNEVRQARVDEFTRQVEEATAAFAAGQSEDESEERRTPRAARRSLAPLAIASRPSGSNASNGSTTPADWTALETPRAAPMNTRSHTVMPRDRRHALPEPPTFAWSQEARSAQQEHSSAGTGSGSGSSSSSRRNGVANASGPSNTAPPAHNQHSDGHGHGHSSHGHGQHSGRERSSHRVRPVLPTTYIAETFDPTDMAFREEEVLLSLQILAYLTKYSHIRALLRFPEMTRASNMQALDELWEKTQTSPGTPLWEEGQTFQRSIYTIAERYTCRATRRDPHAEYIAGHTKLAPLIQYWAAVVMRNACRKDDREDDPRSGLRQCGNMLCGRWEKEPREFAKCRRCKKAKFCSKVCQSTSWQIGHKYWCSSIGEEDEGERARSSRAHGQEADGQSRRGSAAAQTQAAQATPTDAGMAHAAEAAAVPVSPFVANDEQRRRTNDGTQEQPPPIVVDAPMAGSPPDAHATPRLSGRPATMPRRGGISASRSPQAGRQADEPTSSELVDRSDPLGRRTPMQRLPGALPTAIPSRIVSEATSSGLVSDMSEDEGERGSAIPVSDDGASETERPLLRGPSAAPMRTDIAGRPLPPPVIAGSGMELAAGHGLDGGVGLDADDSFGERFIGGLDEQFGQGNIDQIPWRGQTPTAELEEEESGRTLRRSLLQASDPAAATEGADTDGEESSASRRRTTVTQAAFPSALLASTQAEQGRAVSSQHSTMPPAAARGPGLGLPSSIAAANATVNRSASAMPSSSHAAGGNSSSGYGGSIRRIPSSDQPVAEQSRYLYGAPTTATQREGPLEDGSAGIPPWVDSADRESILQRRAVLQRQRPLMNHHQHLLMRGDIAAGMMGRSTTPSPGPLAHRSASGHLGTTSTMSSPSGRDNHQHLISDDRFGGGSGDDDDVDDAEQQTPLTERSDPMQYREPALGDSSGGTHQHETPRVAQWMEYQEQRPARMGSGSRLQQQQQQSRRSGSDASSGSAAAGSNAFWESLQEAGDTRRASRSNGDVDVEMHDA